VVPKAWSQIFVENVTIRYILEFQDYLRKSIKAMFMNSQVGLLSSGILAISAVVAAGSRQALGSGAGIIQSIGRVFGTLIRAAVSALSEKHLAEVKRRLVNAAIDGLVPLIAAAFFAAGRSYYQHTIEAARKHVARASAVRNYKKAGYGDAASKTC